MAASPLALNLGVGAGDPASSVFTATTMPGIRAADLPSALAVYALLVGPSERDDVRRQFLPRRRHQGIPPRPGFRREAQNVGGVYAQDQWRVSPKLTFNYGLRWEFSGAATNPNEVYSSPTLGDLFGPSTAAVPAGRAQRRRQPADPICGRSRTRATSTTRRRTSASRGIPTSLGAGSASSSATRVYRANFGVNYYDEGLINFQTAAGNGPG